MRAMLGTKEDVATIAYASWVEQFGSLRETIAGSERDMDELEVAWKIGFMSAMIAYEEGAIQQLGEN